MPCHSLPWDLFNELHSIFGNWFVLKSYLSSSARWMHSYNWRVAGHHWKPSCHLTSERWKVHAALYGILYSFSKFRFVIDRSFVSTVPRPVVEAVNKQLQICLHCSTLRRLNDIFICLPFRPWDKGPLTRNCGLFQAETRKRDAARTLYLPEVLLIWLF